MVNVTKKLRTELAEKRKAGNEAKVRELETLLESETRVLKILSDPGHPQYKACMDMTTARIKLAESKLLKAAPEGSRGRAVTVTTLLRALLP